MKWPNWKAALGSSDDREQIGIALIFCALFLGGLVVFFPHTAAAPLAETVHADPVVADTYEGMTIEAKAAIVYDLATHKTLFEENADAQLPLASLTKLLTTYAAAGALASGTPVTVSKENIAETGDSGLTEGETFAFEDIARLALVASSNDAAAAIAETAEKRRDVAADVFLQTAAAEVGLAQTYALNGTGLDESSYISGGYGSARDVARLAGALIEKAPEIARATTESSISVRSKDGTVHTLPNTDIAIGGYPHVLLSKTGYTDLAGGNLVVVFDVGINHPIAVAVLASTRDARFTDVDTLIRATLSHFAGIDAPSSL